MGFEENLEPISVEAGSDLSARQYRFMVFTNGKLAVASTGGNADGVLQDKPDASGKVGLVAIAGISKMEAGEQLAAGDPVASDSVGRAVKADVTGNVVLGVAMEAASGAGSIIGVRLHLNRKVIA